MVVETVDTVPWQLSNRRAGDRVQYRVRSVYRRGREKLDVPLDSWHSHALLSHAENRVSVAFLSHSKLLFFVLSTRLSPGINRFVSNVCVFIGVTFLHNLLKAPTSGNWALRKTGLRVKFCGFRKCLLHMEKIFQATSKEDFIFTKKTFFVLFCTSDSLWVTGGALRSLSNTILSNSTYWLCLSRNGKAHLTM